MNFNTQQFADWSNFTNPFVELQQINQAAAEKVVRECISYYSDNAACAVKCAQTMQRVTSPEDFMNTQMKLIAQQGEKTFSFLETLGKIWQDAISEHYNFSKNKVASAMKTAGKVKKDVEED